MLVSLKNSNTTLIGALLLSLLALLLVFQSHSALQLTEERYLSLLQIQTAKYAELQIEQKRVRFLNKHQELLEAMDRQSDVSQMKGVVLEHLEKLVVESPLFEVSYEFLQSKQLMEVTPNARITYDSIRLKGNVNHMVDFNRAMQRLNTGAPVIFELHRCDIRRNVDYASALTFDCSLRWYSLQ